MNREFKTALDRRRILPFAEGVKLVSKELRAATDDLIEAEDRSGGIPLPDPCLPAGRLSRPSASDFGRASVETLRAGKGRGN